MKMQESKKKLREKSVLKKCGKKRAFKKLWETKEKV
jgi:hypothetical protein